MEGLRGPTWSEGGLEARPGRDPMILEHPFLFGRLGSTWRSQWYFQASRHSGAIEGQVDRVHGREFFAGPVPAERKRGHAGHLLDRELDVGTWTLEGENADVFETHQGSEDLIGVDTEEVLQGRWLTPQPRKTFA